MWQGCHHYPELLPASDVPLAHVRRDLEWIVGLEGMVGICLARELCCWSCYRHVVSPPSMPQRGSLQYAVWPGKDVLRLCGEGPVGGCYSGTVQSAGAIKFGAALALGGNTI